MFKVTELGVRLQFCVSCCCDDPRMGGRDPLRPAWAELAAVWISLVDAWVWDARGDKMGEGHQLVALGGEGAGALGAQVRGGHQESAATAAGGQGPKRLLEECSMRTAAGNRGVGGGKKAGEAGCARVGLHLPSAWRAARRGWGRRAVAAWPRPWARTAESPAPGQWRPGRRSAGRYGEPTVQGWHTARPRSVALEDRRMVSQPPREVPR